MSDDKEDKQFEPTEQKLRKAREQGDIPRSAELNSALMYVGAWVGLAVLASVLTKSWLTIAQRAMGGEDWPENATFHLAGTIGKFTSFGVIGVASVPAFTVVLGLLAQRGIVFSGKKLAPDFKRINPIHNAGQKFGASGLMTFAISVGKVTLVILGGWYLFRSLFGVIANTSLMRGDQWISMLGMILGQVLLMAVATSAIFAVLDMSWKWFDHRRRNRMTRKEMQDEHKDSEGDPHMKAARRQKAVDIAMSQMLSDVENADVIIVNPTHYAVALQWKRGSGRAPLCVAKGVDDVAARIRERAKQHEVPIWSDPPCARSIHATVKIGDEIQREHFGPVAAAIRFAEKMRERARAGW